MVMPFITMPSTAAVGGLMILRIPADGMGARYPSGGKNFVGIPTLPIKSIAVGRN
jgi:hypothetical protein